MPHTQGTPQHHINAIFFLAYGHTHIQFALHMQYRCILQLFVSQLFLILSLILQPITHKKVHLILRIRAPHSRRDRKSCGGQRAELMPSNTHSNQLNWERRLALELRSIHVPVNQVKEKLSLQNLSHQIAFTAMLLCIKYNGETTDKKWMLFVLFPLHYYWCISNGRGSPMLLLLGAACFIKEPIKNLEPSEIKECKAACKPSSDCLPLPRFLCVKTFIKGDFSSRKNSHLLFQINWSRKDLNKNTLNQLQHTVTPNEKKDMGQHDIKWMMNLHQWIFNKHLPI